MLLLLRPPEGSTARNICPTHPPGFIIPPKTMLPPRLTVVIWSKLGVTAAFCALLERMHQNWLPVSPPPIKRFPLLSTSSVPNWASLGILIGVCQVAPPSMDRLNCPKSQAKMPGAQYWYWKPWPMLVGVRSIVNHSLSPPPPPRSPEKSVQ